MCLGLACLWPASRFITVRVVAGTIAVGASALLYSTVRPLDSPRRLLESRPDGERSLWVNVSLMAVVALASGLVALVGPRIWNEGADEPRAGPASGEPIEVGLADLITAPIKPVRMSFGRDPRSEPAPTVPNSPKLQIPADIHRAMLDHCLREAPLECCGILGGIPPTVSSIHILDNTEQSETRYQADPRQVIDAMVSLRAAGGQFLAIYHSHPRWVAVPSKTDLETNYYGDLPRIIVGLKAVVPEVRAWRLAADSYEELPWEVVPEVERPAAPGYTGRPEASTPEPPTSTPAMQRTLVIFKPDCVQRRLVGPILARFEAKGLQLAALKLVQVPTDLAERHYAEHKDRPFFRGLIDFITGGPAVVGVLEGPDAIVVLRKLLGKTSGVEAEPGTIRGDYSISKQNNLIHGSDSPESAEREIGMWFKADELVTYQLVDAGWVTV